MSVAPARARATAGDSPRPRRCRRCGRAPRPESARTAPAPRADVAASPAAQDRDERCRVRTPRPVAAPAGPARHPVRAPVPLRRSAGAAARPARRGSSRPRPAPAPPGSDPERAGVRAAPLRRAPHRARRSAARMAVTGAAGAQPSLPARAPARWEPMGCPRQALDAPIRRSRPPRPRPATPPPPAAARRRCHDRIRPVARASINPTGRPAPPATDCVPCRCSRPGTRRIPPPAAAD